MGGELPDGRRRNRQIFKAGFSSPDSDGVLKDEQGELRAKNEIPRLCGNRFPSVDHKLQRYNWKESAWHPANIFSCKADSFHNKTVSHASRLAQLKDIKIGRILYEKPEALKPPRNDVLVVTPWLAPIVWNGAFNRDILNAQFHQMGVRVGLTVFAIKKYVIFLKRFIETAEKFFMVGHKVNYYVFTDRVNEISNFTLAEGRDVVVLEVPAYKRWQDVTMRRMEMIRNFSIEQFVNEVDYLVCVDVDMVFFDDVGVEILSNVFGTLHPGFFGASRQQFTYERRPQSQAYIPFDIGDFYYAGGNFGGIIEEVIKLTNYCHHAMLADKEKNIEALWHDESYLNQYFLFHKPTKVLSPEYIWNYYYGSPGVVQKKRFVGIDKNYKEIRFRRAISNKETASANNSLYLLTEV